MRKKWTPSAWGRALTWSDDWSLTIADTVVIAKTKNKTLRQPLIAIHEISHAHGVVWAVVHVTFPSTALELDGIPNDDAEELVASFREEILKQLRAAIASTSKPLIRTAELLRDALPTQRWISAEEVEALRHRANEETADATELVELLNHPKFGAALNGLPEHTQWAFRFMGADLKEEIRRLNERFAKSELKACRHLFDQIEKNPLTREQAEAVVCFDNRVLVVAAAGSGKTSTLIAKAGYAVYRELISADAILMLAFNRDAAKELQQRIQDRLGNLIPNAANIQAQTFHAFGLSIVGLATGKKPELAGWLERENGVEEIESIIEFLCTKDSIFRTRWALYRVVFADDLPKFGTKEEPEDWDPGTRQAGFKTHRGETVKSREERTIADWLFFNGVNYVYEGKYQIDTADATHRQYRPDFFYPEAKLYHEHFALDEDGLPPDHFTNYLDGVEWKRQVHSANSTALFETTSASLRSGSALDDLGRALALRGVQLAPDPERSVEGRPIPKIRELARSFRIFQAHAKSNRLTVVQLKKRLAEQAIMSLKTRHALFLDLYEQIAKEWDRRLVTANYIDFEDMLHLAADHIEAGRWASPYRLVLADEFQDASYARARLLKALVNAPSRYLFAVGDDWQGINRFAGADIHVMTDFESYFGQGQRLFLKTTFRCPQTLCDLTSQFVMKNPAQISKEVQTTNPRKGTTIHCYAVEEELSLESLLEKHLATLYERVKAGKVKRNSDGRISVFVLGRYRRNRPVALQAWQDRFADRLSITYSTIHGSKGLEADYVFLVHVTQGRHGFPSGIEDDPVHQLAMPEEDPFEFAEERRLFYVALSRAKQMVMIYTVEHKVSQFLVELRSDPYLVPIQSAQGRTEVQACPECQRGALTRRNGRNGPFWGCTRFPACTYTINDEVRGKRIHSRRRRSKQ